MLILDNAEDKRYVSLTNKGVKRENQMNKLVIVDLDKPMSDLDRNLNYRIINRFSSELPRLLMNKKRVKYMEDVSGGTYFIYDHFSRYKEESTKQIRLIAHSLELANLLSKNKHNEIVIYCNSDFLSFKRIEEIFNFIEGVEFYGRLQKRFEKMVEKIDNSRDHYLARHNFNKKDAVSLVRFSPRSYRASIDGATVAASDFHGVVMVDSISDINFLDDVCERFNPRVLVSAEMPTTEANQVFIKHSVFYKKI